VVHPLLVDLMPKWPTWCPVIPISAGIFLAKLVLEFAECHTIHPTGGGSFGEEKVAWILSTKIMVVLLVEEDDAVTSV